MQNIKYWLRVCNVRLKHQQSQNNNTEIPENGCGHWKFQKILVGVGLHIQYV